MFGEIQWVKLREIGWVKPGEIGWVKLGEILHICEAIMDRITSQSIKVAISGSSFRQRKTT